MDSRVTLLGTFLCPVLLICMREMPSPGTRDQDAPHPWFPPLSPLGSESCSISVKGISRKKQGASGCEARAGWHREGGRRDRVVRGWGTVWGERSSRQFPQSLDKPVGQEEGVEKSVGSASSVPEMPSCLGQEPC